MILYGHDKHGGFVCGVSSFETTAYAYPTSENAEKAKTRPTEVARAMLADEIAFRGILLMEKCDLRDAIERQDIRNWDLLTMVLL